MILKNGSSSQRRRMTMKCDTCKVHKRVMESEAPACCVWLLDNVVCGDKSVEDCPVYEEDKHETD